MNRKAKEEETHHPANTVSSGREQDPGVRLLVGNDVDKVSLVALDIRVFGDIQRVCGTDQADVSERQLLLVRLGQDTLLFQLSVESLSHGRVGTVGTDKDITVVGRVVPAADHDTVLVLQQRQDFLAHVDLFLGHKLGNDVVQHWTGNDVRVVSVSSAGSKRKVSQVMDPKDTIKFD